MSSVEQHLQSPNFIEITLDQLETVEIRWMFGSRAELHLNTFIRLLLASSALLRWMNVKNISAIDDPKEEFMQFPKASTSGQIMWFQLCTNNLDLTTTTSNGRAYDFCLILSFV
ncbi:hypothetical protein POM88_036403 [Heracleum sosnowskyi]|uniref:FBD domain-containing protein n=1 Tax=Heracleum sosnowskyi TaxID=360622 RepID=A0AAD8HNB8_9APIA|nr:hypothetical protein POM88_036403 [Heracleum sosnowskyi]